MVARPKKTTAKSEPRDPGKPDLPLRRFYWVYFFIVPLTAISASTVAIVIAALNGLANTEQTTRLFAIITIIGLKLLVSIGIACGIAILLTLAGIGFYRLGQNMRVIIDPPKPGPKEDQMDERRQMLEMFGGADRAMAMAGIIYALGTLWVFVDRWIMIDILEGWKILRSMAGNYPPLL